MPTQLSPNGVSAVLFDLDGTLRHNLPSSNHTFFDYAAQLGAVDTPERRRKALRWVHNYWAQSAEMLRDKQIYGGLTDSFWSFYASRTLISFACPEEQALALGPLVHQRMQSEYEPVDYVSPDTWDTLTALRAAGFANTQRFSWHRCAAETLQVLEALA